MVARKQEKVKNNMPSTTVPDTESAEETQSTVETEPVVETQSKAEITTEKTSSKRSNKVKKEAKEDIQDRTVKEEVVVKKRKTKKAKNTSEEEEENVKGKKGKNKKKKIRKTRTPSNYVLFSMEHRKQVTEQDSSLTLGEVSKRCGDAWKQLDDESKAVWTAKANELKRIRAAQEPNVEESPLKKKR